MVVLGQSALARGSRGSIGISYGGETQGDCQHPLAVCYIG